MRAPVCAHVRLDLRGAAGQRLEGHHRRAVKRSGDCLRARVGDRHRLDGNPRNRRGRAQVHPVVVHQDLLRRGRGGHANSVRRQRDPRDRGRAHGPAGHRRRFGEGVPGRRGSEEKE